MPCDFAEQKFKDTVYWDVEYQCTRDSDDQCHEKACPLFNKRMNQNLKRSD